MCGILAIVSLVMIVYFIHHIAMNIQADAVIARLGSQLTRAIQDDENRMSRVGVYIERHDYDAASEKAQNAGTPVAAPSSGYVQSIDKLAIRDLAIEHNLEVSLCRRPGHFVLEGTGLAYLAPRVGDGVPATCLDAVLSYMVLGGRRTRQQHIEFEINALVEVALRALSPSMNDPLTAVACANRIFVGLRTLLGQRNRIRVLMRDDDVPVVIPLPRGFGHYLDIAVNPLRLAGKGDLVFAQNLFSSLRDLAELSSDPSERESIRRQIYAFSSNCLSENLEDFDRERLTACAEAARQAAS